MLGRVRGLGIGRRGLSGGGARRAFVGELQGHVHRLLGRRHGGQIAIEERAAVQIPRTEPERPECRASSRWRSHSACPGGPRWLWRLRRPWRRGRCARRRGLSGSRCRRSRSHPSACRSAAGRRVVPPASLAPMQTASMTPKSPPHTTVQPCSARRRPTSAARLYSFRVGWPGPKTETRRCIRSYSPSRGAGWQWGRGR